MRKPKLNRMMHTTQIYEPAGNADGLHQWGGTFHTRTHFNKKKDFLKEWTEVLFRP